MYTPALDWSWAEAPVEATRPQLLPRLLLLLGGLVVAGWFVPPVGTVFCGALILHALRGPKQVVEAFSLLSFLLIIGADNISVLRWLVLFSGFGRMIWDLVIEDEPVPPIIVPLLALSLTILVFSLLASQLPMVSVFKDLSFTVGVGTVILAFSRTRHLRTYWISWFFSLMLFIVLASFPLLFTSLGFSRNGVGFQGILVHPQTFGPVAAPIAAYLTGLLLFQHSRSRLVLLGAATAWLGAYASLSRTALLAAMLGLSVTVLIALFRGRTWRPILGAAFLRLPVVIGALLLFVVLLLNLGAVKQVLMEFMLKDDAESSVTESLTASRGELIERSMNNFRSAPVTGIGLGVPSDPQYTRVETGFLGLPIGASVEKGFMPSAVLEETGVVGALLVLVLLAALFAPVLRQNDLSLFWMLLTCLLVNMGEMVFFSIGGMGLHFWIVMLFCHAVSFSEAGAVRNLPRSL